MKVVIVFEVNDTKDPTEVLAAAGEAARDATPAIASRVSGQLLAVGLKIRS